MSESIPFDSDRDEGALDRGEPTREQIEQRAYELSQSDEAGTPEETGGARNASSAPAPSPRRAPR